MSTLTMSAPTIQNPAADRLRRTSTGIALVLAPLLLIAGNLLTTAGDSASPAWITKVATSAGGEQISIICFLLGFTAFIPAAFGLLGMVGRRGSLLGTLGAWLAAIGLMAFAGLETSGVANIGVARSLPTAQAVRVITAMENVGAAGVIFLLGLGLPVGLILVACAVRRARLVPLWMPIIAALGLLVVMFLESTIGGIVGDLLMLASFGYVGVRLLAGAGIRDAVAA